MDMAEFVAAFRQSLYAQRENDSETAVRANEDLQVLLDQPNSLDGLLLLARHDPDEYIRTASVHIIYRILSQPGTVALLEPPDFFAVCRELLGLYTAARGITALKSVLRLVRVMMRLDPEHAIFADGYRAMRNDPALVFHALWFGSSLVARQPEPIPGDLLEDLGVCLGAAVQVRCQLGDFIQRLEFFVKVFRIRRDFEYPFLAEFQPFWIEMMRELRSSPKANAPEKLLLGFWTETFQVCPRMGRNTVLRILAEAIRTSHDQSRLIGSRLAPIAALAKCWEHIPVFADPDQQAGTQAIIRSIFAAEFNIFCDLLAESAPAIVHPQSVFLETIAKVYGGDACCQFLLSHLSRGAQAAAVWLAASCIYCEVLFDTAREACLAYLDDFSEFFQQLFQKSNDLQVAQAICNFIHSFNHLGLCFQDFVNQFLPFLLSLVRGHNPELGTSAMRSLASIRAFLTIETLREICAEPDLCIHLDNTSFITIFMALLEQENHDDYVQHAMTMIEQADFSNPETFLQSRQLIGRLAVQNEQLTDQIMDQIIPTFRESLLPDAPSRIESAIGILLFLSTLETGLGQPARAFVSEFLGACLQTVLPLHEYIQQEDLIMVVCTLLPFLPDEEVRPVCDALQEHFVAKLAAVPYAGCLRFLGTLYTRLPEEFQTDLIQRVYSFVPCLFDVTEPLLIDWMLFDVVLPLAKADARIIPMAYKIGESLYQAIARNRLLEATCYAYLGKLARFEDEGQGHIVDLILRDLADSRLIALNAALNLVKHQLVNNDVILQIVIEFVGTVQTDEDRLLVATTLCRLLAQNHQNTLQFVTQEVEVFTTWAESSAPDLHDMAVEMLLYLVVYQPDANPEFAKKLIRQFPLRGSYHQARRAVKSILRIAASDRAGMYAEQLFIAAISYFASDAYNKNVWFMLVPEDVVQLEDLLLELSDRLNIGIVFPEFEEAAANESMKMNRLQLALGNARARALQVQTE
jgi:hypothetical protein